MNGNSRLLKFRNPLVSLIWNFTRRSNVTNYREQSLLMCLGKVYAVNVNSRLFKFRNPLVSLIRNLQHGLVSQDGSALPDCMGCNDLNGSFVAL